MALQEELSDAKERNIQLAARLQQKEVDMQELRERLEVVHKVISSIMLSKKPPSASYPLI